MPVTSRARFIPAVTRLEARDTPAVGTLDPTFGDGGRAVIPIDLDPADPQDDGRAVVAQPDGRVWVIGTAQAVEGGETIVVVRLGPDGRPDPTFGTGGRVLVSFQPDRTGVWDRAWAATAQADGKVVVVGSTSMLVHPGRRPVVCRLNPDGSLDRTFGGDGRADVGDPGNPDVGQAYAVAVDGKGRIVVAGSSGVPGDGVLGGVAVWRLNPDGSPDRTFDGDGLAVAPFRGPPLGNGSYSYEAEARAVAILPGDRVAAAGSTVAPTAAGAKDIAVAVFREDGSPDTGFNGTGRLTLAFDLGGVRPGVNEDEVTGLAAAPGGGLLLAGSVAYQLPPPGPTGGRAATDAVVARLTPAGQLDPTFNGRGWVRLGFDRGTGSTVNGYSGTNDRAVAVLAGPAGKVVAVGVSEDTRGPANDVSTDYFATQLLPDGRPDPGFGAGGTTFVRFDERAAGANGLPTAAVADPAGRILITGSVFGASAGSLYDFAVVRLIGEPPPPPPPPPPPAAGPNLIAGGSNGRAVVHAPDAAGRYADAPAATLTPFSGFAGSVRSAQADVDGDGVPDTVLVTGPGVPIRFAVVSGKDHATVLVPPTDPFGGGFGGGGFVAAADLDGDGRAEWAVTPDQGGGPRVSVFSRNPDGTVATRASFLGIDDSSFRGGARAALGDVNADGTPDLAVSAGFLGGPRTALFSGKSLLGGSPARLVADFFAFPGSDATTLRNGVFVAAGDLDGDGFAELVFGGGPGGAPRVFALSGKMVAGGDVAGAQARPVSNFFVAGNTADRGGVRVAVSDADADGKADLLAGSGAGSPARVRVYLGKNLTSSAEPGTVQDLAPFGGAALADGVYVG